MKATITFEVVFKIQPATGPNPQHKGLEVMDNLNMRLMYTDDLDEAENFVAEYVDPEGILCASMSTVEDDS